MKSIVFLFILAISACGMRHSSVNYGKTTISDLVASHGVPVEERKIPTKEGRILTYSNNEKFQIKDEIVSHGFRDPNGDEKNLIFWKHKFRDCETETKKISERVGHLAPEYELKCGQEGVTVIYSEGSEFISRIIEHEKE